MKPKILIFDSDQAITKQLFWTLCDDYDVVTANNLQTAVRRAVAYDPDVVILDLSAEIGANAIRLRTLEYLRAHVPQAKIVGLVSDNALAIRQHYLKRGVDEFLEKPFDTEQLLQFLRRLAPAHPLDLADSGAFRLCY